MRRSSEHPGVLGQGVARGWFPFGIHDSCPFRTVMFHVERVDCPKSARSVTPRLFARLNVPSSTTHRHPASGIRGPNPRSSRHPLFHVEHPQDDGDSDVRDQGIISWSWPPTRNPEVPVLLCDRVQRRFAARKVLRRRHRAQTPSSGDLFTVPPASHSASRVLQLWSIGLEQTRIRVSTPSLNRHIGSEVGNETRWASTSSASTHPQKRRLVNSTCG